MRRGFFVMAITPESAQIMKLLGMGASELDIPLRFSMFEEVARYFGDDSSARQDILKILSKSAAKDNLEAVWRYVRLQNEKADAIKSLDPADFEDDISDEIKTGYLTIEKMKRVKEDMAKVEKKAKDEPDNSPIVQQATKIERIKKVFNVVEEINSMIETYG